MTTDSPLPLPALNGATMLRALFKRPRRTHGQRTPRTHYLLEQLDANQLRRYRQALGFRDEGIPLTYWYLLAQRAQVATMLDDAFPFRLPGTVHTANAIQVTGNARRDAPLLLATTVHIHPPTDHGAVCADLETTASQDAAEVFHCRSTYLLVRGQRGPRRQQRGAQAGLPVLARWQLGRKSGRDYARVSGDWNPIHLWSWSARLMGMRRPIIHGMHTLARACAELEQASGQRVVALDGRFKAPAALGSELVLGADLGARQFSVGTAGRPVAEGSFRFA
ncbi:MaoC/PaaZ C-terminal domain-containing protein [uncultured Massilia sp.]|uniref:MaoC/PaaZ C-terminal domain-containing protein n=1 Tax=uncultured Massilia sp. TaxID=169973 RepID=UPI0025CC49D6|nr:MaoC/PaaZ C-terminal domain-containing protein [uncultured Massilia sp.]